MILHRRVIVTDEKANIVTTYMFFGRHDGTDRYLDSEELASGPQELRRALHGASRVEVFNRETGRTHVTKDTDDAIANANFLRDHSSGG